MKNKSLYVHIPFCFHKCAYCDFYSLSDYSFEEDYTNALIKEFGILGEKFKGEKFSTVFIGGGTPTSLSEKSLDKILETLNSSFSLEKDSEFSIEANPATFDNSKLSLIKSHGVNRISIGLQSANDNELLKLSRIHTYSEFLKAYDIARKYFDNINIDLMYDIPLQTLSSFENTLDKVTSLKPEHISAYGLRIEENTPFGRMKDLVIPSEDEFEKMYLYLSDYLREKGYFKYEISNFALDGKECLHNLAYWQRHEYLGIGPGAHSFIENRRFSVKKSVKWYIESVLSKNEPIYDESYDVSYEDSVNETIMLSLRLSRGLSLKSFEDEFSLNIISDFGDIIEGYIKKGLMKCENGMLSLTDRGMLVSNYIISDILYF